MSEVREIFIVSERVKGRSSESLGTNLKCFRKSALYPELNETYSAIYAMQIILDYFLIKSETVFCGGWWFVKKTSFLNLIQEVIGHFGLCVFKVFCCAQLKFANR